MFNLVMLKKVLFRIFVWFYQNLEEKFPPIRNLLAYVNKKDLKKILLTSNAF